MSSLGVVKAIEFLKDLHALFVIDDSLVDFSKLVIDIGNFGITEGDIFMNWSINIQDYLHGTPEVFKSFFIFSFCH